MACRRRGETAGSGERVLRGESKAGVDKRGGRPVGGELRNCQIRKQEAVSLGVKEEITRSNVDCWSGVPL